MHILHVTSAYYPATYWGGPIFSVYGLNNALANLPEIEIQVLTTDSAGPLLSQRLEAANLNMEELYPNQIIHFTRRILRSSTSLEMLMKLPALVNWADVVHLTGTYSFPTFPTLLACRLFGKPLVWSPRGALQDAQKLEFSRKKRLKNIWNFLCNMLLNPDKTVLHTTSIEERDFSLSSLPGARAVVISNGIDTPLAFPKRDYCPNGELRLLFLSRLHRKKGVENLLDAMVDLKDLNISLSIYGTGDKAYVTSLQERAQKLGLLDGRVHFYGHVDGESKQAAFMNADVFVLPSYSENYGIAIAEALSYGVPVIASHGTPWQKVEEKKCGLWVDNTPQSLGEAVRTIRQMDLADMGRRGWQWMKDDFSWHYISTLMFQSYLELIMGSSMDKIYEESKI